MATGPFRSKLGPFYDQIAAWRTSKPPMAFTEIAALLKEEFQLEVDYTTIIRFLRVRRRLGIAHPDSRVEKKPLPSEQRTTTGRVPHDVQARIEDLKRKPSPVEEPKPRLSFLPADGILTFKEKP